MLMDAEFKKEQNGTLFVLVGPMVGPLRGSGSEGSAPKFTRAFLEKKNSPPVVYVIKQ